MTPKEKETRNRKAMTEKQQTAIEWLIEAIKIHDKSFDEFYKAEIEQAKQMEREQIIDAYDYGHNEGCSYMYGGYSKSITAEKYFNQTYQKQ